MIIVNGNIVAQGSQFSLNDVEVVTAIVDIEEVRSARFAPSRAHQSHTTPSYKRIETEFSISNGGVDFDPKVLPTPHRELSLHSAEEEIAMGPAVWLW